MAAAVAAGPAEAAKPQLSISVLSGRADLVSGGSALVAIKLPPGADTKRLKVMAGARDVTSEFAVRSDGRFAGLVDGLALGAIELRATLPGASGAKLTLTNHPIGGPVFSGPQLKHWGCQPGALDAQCNQDPTFTYLYKSTNPAKQGLQPYDPGNPPADVATTTTDRGVTVPFIVRLETGYMDRDQYKIATLYEPGKPWTPFDPQAQFNRKLLIFHGAGCGVDYQTGSAPDVTVGIAPDALGRGFMTMSTALDNAGHNCNVALQAESLVMAKEHIAKTYGTLRYTIGTGCSGGSLAIQWIANAYPGVYQGILPTCSFPDAWSTATQFLDYHLLLEYFTDPSKWGAGAVWLPTQMADVMGHVTIANAEVSEQAQFHVAVPTQPCAGTTDANRYHPQSNPGGVRCTIHDAAINIFGPNPPATWSAPEKAIGRGFAVPPVDNVGVQYGLKALERGQITPAQFVDLNEKIGGLDIDTNPTAARIDTGPAPALANAYRSGMINETNNLDETALIDCRGPDPGLFHDSYRAFAIRARLDREHGTHANQLIWEGPVPVLGDAECERNSFIAMDRWLAAVERDAGAAPLAEKVIRNKPADLSDRCYSGAGQKLSSGLCPDAVVPVYGTPRMVAGDAITTDANKCQRKPLRRADYVLRVGGVPVPVPFSDAEWAQLQRTFPSGVCDFSRPGVDQQGTIPWQTYQDANGNVIYGGKPLGTPPVSQALRP